MYIICMYIYIIYYILFYIYYIYMYIIYTYIYYILYNIYIYIYIYILYSILYIYIIYIYISIYDCKAILISGMFFPKYRLLGDIRVAPWLGHPACHGHQWFSQRAKAPFIGHLMIAGYFLVTCHILMELLRVIFHEAIWRLKVGRFRDGQWPQALLKHLLLKARDMSDR